MSRWKGFNVMVGVCVNQEVQTIDPHHGRRYGVVVEIDDRPSLLFGPIIWVQFTNGVLEHFTLGAVSMFKKKRCKRCGKKAMGLWLPLEPGKFIRECSNCGRRLKKDNPAYYKNPKLRARMSDGDSISQPLVPGAPRAGSRKSVVFHVFKEHGPDRARQKGLELGLKPGTINSWFGTWKRLVSKEGQ